MHTIWVRYHNYLVEQLTELNPHWGPEQLYEEARMIVSVRVAHFKIFWQSKIQNHDKKFLDYIKGQKELRDRQYSNLGSTCQNILSTQVLALHQKITFYDYLPLIIGDSGAAALGPYQFTGGYDPNIDATIANVFRLVI